MQHRIDTATVSDMVAALTREMMPNRAPRHAGTDTLFLGGWDVSDDDRGRMARFGRDKNYNVVFVSFGENASEGLVDYDVVVTDGIGDAVVLADGRLWKRDERRAAVLLFRSVGALIKLSTKMSKRPRRNHSPAFKAKVALAAVKGGATQGSSDA